MTVQIEIPDLTPVIRHTEILFDRTNIDSRLNTVMRHRLNNEKIVDNICQAVELIITLRRDLLHAQRLII